jgi:hypothetical protein
MADTTTTSTSPDQGDQLGVQRLLDIVRAVNNLSDSVSAAIAAISALILQSEEEIVPSGSTDGSPIKVAATSTPGTLFHTASATSLDNIWLYATNVDTASRTLTVEFGDATSPDHHIVMTILPGDNICVISGVPLTNSKTVKCYASAANVVNMYGFVNRITTI